jgi:hypothetical protein
MNVDTLLFWHGHTLFKPEELVSLFLIVYPLATTAIPAAKGARYFIGRNPKAQEVDRICKHILVAPPY